MKAEQEKISAKVRAVSMHLNGGKLQLPAEEESCYVVLVAESGCTLQYAEQTMLLNPGSALLLGPGGGCIQQTGRFGPLSPPAMPPEFYQTVLFHGTYLLGIWAPPVPGSLPPRGRAGKEKSLRPCKRTKAKKTLRCTTCYLRTNIRAPCNGGHRQGLLSALWCSACSSGGIFRLPRYFLRALTIPESLQGSADPTVSIIAVVIGFV